LIKTKFVCSSIFYNNFLGSTILAIRMAFKQVNVNLMIKVHFVT